ncbi:sporulation and cell division protein SsgA [Nocardiopsis sp. Huas11]|uniref:SsgA family sporulation/cell division regulator n=1 Tax=Nocardiopsis sp. Huas11 TaxID=2183912 RepID=UPI000F184F59|nr:SsgA family sporulation/cell division regulator [Nocardiopsis sp. Huas11]RKS10003.1 sporulation and cell division protein SsgA [Nocardiopsis sp. Huas11]
MSAATITHHTQWMSSDDDQTVHDLQLAYDPAHPYAIEARFVLDSSDPDAVLVWEVDRGVLDQGVASWAGDGDVRVRVWTPLPTLVLVELLDGITGRWGRFLARRTELEAFLAETYRLVPSGTEHVDVDATVAALLTGGEL